ncbi:histidine kinase N-terminal 7TM domain-containing protein [Pedobacter sp. KR3-3]|uniref:histidine kinase n=1 Tax=Pedobacter albus TaxID=3113905 RepID=A0ABU7I6E3_9SPHI|nr:histidine kinase N-terminal 7TM domain-containing protein [Pedobacter sp. KR3-3]MEE1945031.1 histidine kinase N-terminal 7TM domain-containing protein [Pedobacter sp. KR3-3]
MEFSFNIYAIVLLACGCTTIVLSNYIYRRGGEAVKWFSMMMLSNAIWSTAYGFELASSTLSQIKFLINIEYIGIATLPLNWFLFCLSFCDKECWYKKRLNLALILIAPIVTILMVWTNSYHHLHYKHIEIATDGPFPMVAITPGIWYRIFTIYFYLLLACGCYLILMKFRTSDPIYKKQNYSIVIAAFIPWLANMSYLLGLRPFAHLDITPFAFVLTSFFILIGIYRFKLFDIIPIAREKVLELMQDGFFVLDQQNRIIDYNKSIQRYISIAKDQKIIGTQLEKIFPNQPYFFERIKNHQSGKIELDVTLENKILYLEADILFLVDNKINNDFTIIKLQDLTNFKREAIRTKEQANELEKLNQLKDRIFSIIAHDLRGPLVNLSEVLKMIANDQITREEFKSISPTLSKDIIYTTDLLENILHWSRSQLKGFGIKKEFFNLRNLIINEINYHLPAATTKKIKIIHDVFPGEMVYADILMIQIVMRNILNNAIKFCHENCEIHITAVYQRNGTMLVCIQDNGVGIPAHVLERLFKNENITTRGTFNEKGTGIGLMVCKDFMIRNDGDITVSSQEGQGAKFCLSLPTSK